MRATIQTALLIMITGAMGAWGAMEKTASVLDAAGRQSSGDALKNLSACGQAGGIRISSHDSLVNYAGYINTFSLQPELDTDLDGLANEFDADNDNDNLLDLAEVAGAAFDPTTQTAVNNPDTDLDGATDGEEAEAGTNPLDDTMFLRITGISAKPATGVRLTWTARGGRQYRVYRLPEMDDQTSPVALGTVQAEGGTGPWRETSASVTDPEADPGNARFFYYVETGE